MVIDHWLFSEDLLEKEHEETFLGDGNVLYLFSPSFFHPSLPPFFFFFVSKAKQFEIEK
jgi:hypothetical protein